MMHSQQSVCWWCGALADSREHRFKRSQMVRRFAINEYLVLGSGTPSRLNGPGAKPLRFPKVLCRQCNNSRSQPFDRAYDTFTDLVWKAPELFRTNSVDWTTVFPDGMTGAKLLCRYFVKNFGCRIAETGFSVPPELVDFLNGASLMPHATLILYKDFSQYDEWRCLGQDEQESQTQYANRMFTPEKSTEGPLDAFCCELQDGPVGAVFWWDRSTDLGINFCGQEVVPLRDREQVPYRELHESYWSVVRTLREAKN